MRVGGGAAAHVRAAQERADRTKEVAARALRMAKAARTGKRPGVPLAGGSQKRRRSYEEPFSRWPHNLTIQGCMRAATREVRNHLARPLANKYGTPASQAGLYADERLSPRALAALYSSAHAPHANLLLPLFRELVTGPEHMRKVAATRGNAARLKELDIELTHQASFLLTMALARRSQKCHFLLVPLSAMLRASGTSNSGLDVVVSQVKAIGGKSLKAQDKIMLEAFLPDWQQRFQLEPCVKALMFNNFVQLQLLTATGESHPLLPPRPPCGAAIPDVPKMLA